MKNNNLGAIIISFLLAAVCIIAGICLAGKNLDDPSRVAQDYMKAVSKGKFNKAVALTYEDSYEIRGLDADDMEEEIEEHLGEAAEDYKKILVSPAIFTKNEYGDDIAYVDVTGLGEESSDTRQLTLLKVHGDWLVVESF
ncbi:MAG: hypothetical protein K6C99_07515 [Lachnospiraceae bacterium]|nr:hypothetical protein [Lachnospiraceae bacterium]